MARKMHKRSGTNDYTPKREAESAGRNIRGGKTIMNARRARDAKLGSIMDDLAAGRKKK